MKHLYRSVAGSILALAATMPIHADDHEALIALARSAAPDLVSADATVAFRGDVLVEGSNGWVCLPETLPDDGAPMCNDAVWMELMGAMAAGEPYTVERLGISYMLAGDAGVSNSNPAHPDGANAPVQAIPAPVSAPRASAVARRRPVGAATSARGRSTQASGRA